MYDPNVLMSATLALPYSGIREYIFTREVSRDNRPDNQMGVQLLGEQLPAATSVITLTPLLNTESVADIPDTLLSQKRRDVGLKERCSITRACVKYAF